MTSFLILLLQPLSPFAKLQTVSYKYRTVLVLLVGRCLCLKAELQATEAERSVTKLQKEVDRLEGKIGIKRTNNKQHHQQHQQQAVFASFV